MNSMNTLQAAIPGSIAMSVLLVLLSLFVIFLDRMWKKLPPDQPAVYA
jgi:Na+-transporting NADH:ubiquinone oxidoreductase subunit NqrD